MNNKNRNKNRIPKITNRKRGNKPMTKKEKKINRHYPFLPEKVDNDEVIVNTESELLNNTTLDTQGNIEKMFEGASTIINKHYAD